MAEPETGTSIPVHSPGLIGWAPAATPFVASATWKPSEPSDSSIASTTTSLAARGLPKLHRARWPAVASPSGDT